MQRHTLSRSLTLALMAGTLLAGCNEAAAPAPGAMPPTAVDVVTLQQAPLTLTTELTGRTAALRLAEVRPQVSGIILKRYFTEGSDVRAGQVLYQIDPATYEAAVASAEATLAKAEATEQSARLKAQRYAALAKVKAISTQDNDDAQASWRQAVADIAAAKAALKSSKINLGYTRITAPISGRIGKSAVTEGALVTAQQATSLTSIQQLDPMYVDVTQSSTDLLRLRQLYAAGKLTSTKDGAVVHFRLEDGSQLPQSGRLQFSDVTVDESTGMVTVRAQVPNPDKLLLPGMFIRAELQQGERPQGLLVPQAAVARTARGGASVMLVGGDNKVEQRDIEVSQALNGNWVVESGLKAGERVIVAGLQKVKAGAAVNPKDVTPVTPANKQ
ncbi:efflux RND transporter periplasmic adaptor subunit [Pseudaeromonas sharmana]|uniref:Efflux RND transporter periplasmic adaptor subunit n=1 Tax=Pseudaeromonas sharmana TaxID=328412 RepID=A0ABV8CLI7_9GAMM